MSPYQNVAGEAPLENQRFIYRSDTSVSDLKKLLENFPIHITPESGIYARGFYLGMFSLTEGANTVKLNSSFGNAFVGFPAYQNMYSDLWKLPYKVNKVSIEDAELADIYKNINWDTVGDIKTEAYMRANGDTDVNVSHMEIEYLLTEMNQIGSGAGILSKQARLIGSLSNSVLETGTGFGVFSRAFLAGRPKKFVTCDPKRWFDAPAKLAKISEQNGIDFEFFHGHSLDYKPPHNFDAIFFDGNHDYGYLVKEMELLAPYSNKYLVLHDTNVPAVGKAVVEWLNKDNDWAECFTDIKANGFSVLARRSEMDDTYDGLPQMFF